MPPPPQKTRSWHPHAWYPDADMGRRGHAICCHILAPSPFCQRADLVFGYEPACQPQWLPSGTAADDARMPACRVHPPLRVCTPAGMAWHAQVSSWWLSRWWLVALHALTALYLPATLVVEQTVGGGLYPWWLTYSTGKHA